jgi:4-amino-4-deoxy-L-arabinose transferase-like glycosyltransferase
MPGWVRGEWLRTSAGRWALAILAVALLVRIGVVAYVHPDPRDGRYDDSLWYDTSARHLAAGDGYVFDANVWRAPNGDPTYPGEYQLTDTALWPPGYPVTLGVIYKATGDSVAAGLVANVIFGSLTCVLVYLIARRLAGEVAAVLSGVALALLPSHALFTAVLLSETYFGFLLALLLTLFLYFVLDRENPNVPLILGLGALTAFTGYVRGEFLAYGGFLALLMLLHWRRRAILPLAAFALGAALVVTPWAVRNRIQMGETVIGTTGAGRVSYQGHNPETDGGASLEVVGKLEARFAGQGRQQIELQANKEGSRLAREWALDHKLEELQLIPKRMYRLFRSDESGVTWVQSNKPWFGSEGADRLIRLSSFTFFGLIALALAGLPLWWRSRDTKMWAVFGIAPFYMVVFGVLFIGDPRYHYALYLPITIFAGPALAALWSAVGAGWREVAGGRSPGDILRTYGAPEP